MTESGGSHPSVAALGDLDVTSDLGTVLERAVAYALGTITGDCAASCSWRGTGWNGATSPPRTGGPRRPTDCGRCSEMARTTRLRAPS